MTPHRLERVHALYKLALFTIAAFALVLTLAARADAQADTFLLGNGSGGAFTASAGTTTLNHAAPVTAAASSGSSTVTIGTERTGGYGAVASIAANRLVLIVQTTGFTGTATDGSPTGIDLSGDAVGSWELARIQSVAGSNLTLTSPLLHSYAASGAQVVTIPEFTTATIGGGNTVQALDWNGTSGGFTGFLATGAVTINGTITALGRGFRGGTVRNTTQVGCTQLVQGNNNRKGEGIVPAYFDTAGGDTSNGVGAGNKANGAGGGDCAEGGGGGGSNHGLGGQGGNTSDGDRAFGGRGGAPLTYSVYDHFVFGGGGGSGDDNSGANGAGGAGGGVVFIRGASLTGTGTITSAGANGANSTNRQASAGGGAGGGIVYARFTGSVSCTTMSVAGGDGGSTPTSGFSSDGSPGGGGGGGKALIQGSSVSCTPTTNSGVAGTNPAGVADGATPTTSGGASNVGQTTNPGSALAAPTSTVTSPVNGSSTANLTPTITGTGTANAVQQVYIDGVLAGQTTADGSGNWSFTPASPLTNAAHSVYATPTLNGITGSNSTTVNFTVDNVAPSAPTITTPASSPFYTNDTTPTVAGTAEANSTVRVYDGATLVGTTTANGSGNWTLDTSALSAGSHTITATATDAAGNVSAASTSKTIIVDTTAPAAPVITTPATSPFNTNDTTPTVSGTAEANSTVRVYDGATLVGTTTADGSGNWTLDTSALSAGSHTITATATDAASNTSAASTSKTIIVDTTAPAAPVITTPATSPFNTNDTTPTVSGTAEANSTVRVYDGATLVGTTTANGSGNWTLDTSALSVGSHTITATATDAANNTSAASASKTIIVDTTAPAAPVITTPATSPFNTNDTTPTVAGTAEANSTVRVYDGATLVGTTTADGSGNWTLDTSALSVGSHTITATATDAASNTSAASSSKTIIVDTTAPAAPVITTPLPSPYYTSDTTPTVSGTAEANSTVRVYDGVTLVGTTTANGSGNWTLDTSALSVGSHTITATATDAASNTSAASSSKTIVVDTTAPAAPVITTPATSPFNTSDTTPTVAGTAEANSTVRVYDGATLVGTTTADGSGNWTLDTSALSVGSHTITATATDLAGNASAASTSKTIVVDTTAPAAPVITTPATSPFNTSDTTPTVAGTAEANSTVRVYDGATLVGTTTADGSGNWTLDTSVLSEGSHTITATATDAANNTSAASASKTIVVDTTAPAAPVITTPATSPFYSPTATPTVAGTAEANSTVRVYDGATLVGTTTADGSGDWSLSTSSLATGSHTITATAADAAGNTSSASGSKVIVVDTTAPTVSITAPVDGSITSDDTPTLSFTVTETNAGTTECSIDGGAFAPCSSGSPTTALGDGSHTIVVRHTDLAGNVGSASTTFTVDTGAPAAPTITSGPTGTVTSDSAAFTFTGESGGSYECYIDSPVAWTACTSPESYSSLGDGPHTFHVRQIDDAGNVGPEATQDWAVDTTGPPAPSVSGPIGTVGSTSATITFSDTESPVTFMCSLDGGTATLCTSPESLSGLADGPHSYEVYAVDQFGNPGPSTTINWTVDHTLFTVSITDGPTGTVATDDNTFEFVATNTAGTTYMCRVDSDPFTACTSPFDTGVLSEGAHTFEVYAENGADTTPTVSASFTIDTSAPSIAISGPTEGATTAPDGDVTFSASDATGPVTTTCAIDGGTPVACSSPWSYSGLSDGAHSVTVTATDGVGNATSSVRNFVVDGTPPETTIDSHPSAVTGSTDADFTFSSSEGSSTFECSLDGGPFGSCVSPVNLTGLAEGHHEFQVRAIDQYGNVDPTPASYEWDVDTTAPAAPVITSPSDNDVTGDPTVTVTGTAEPGSVVTVSEGATVLCTATADSSGDWTCTTSSLSDGGHTLSATAEDASGNTSPASSDVDITVDTTAPIVSISAPANNSTVGTNTPQITFTATDTNLDAVECSVDSGAWTPCTSPFTTGSLSDGSHTVSVRATDMAGNTATDSVTVTVDTTAPQTTITAHPASLDNDTTPSFSFSSNEGGSTFECQIDSGSWTTCTSPLTVSPALSDGPHTFSVRATDASGNTDATPASYTWTIDTTPPTGSVVQAPGNVPDGKNPKFDITKGDPTDTTTCSVDGGTAVACSSLYTPADVLAPGTHTLLVTFTDEAGNTHVESITFTVTAAAQPTPSTPTTPTDGGDSDPLPAGCFNKGIAISNLAVSGSKVVITGFARLRYAGQTVSITYKPTKNTVVATAVVGSDGSFTASAKAPKKSLRLSNKTLYRASVGNENTQWTKLARRVASSTASYANGKLIVKGLLTKPLMRKTPVTVNARTGCSGPWRKVGSAKVSGSGKFSFSKSYKASTGVVFVKVAAIVSKGGKKPRALRTYSFVIPVVTR